MCGAIVSGSLPEHVQAVDTSMGRAKFETESRNAFPLLAVRSEVRLVLAWPEVDCRYQNSLWKPRRVFSLRSRTWSVVECSRS